MQDIWLSRKKGGGGETKKITKKRVFDAMFWP